jgi:crotonobetainyl-CoA:carnitine CoA-transferase CaiB-like acyl-CoA transferase
VVAPLQGVRVLEVANWMAGPGAAAMMADMGADVVKVEPLRGDAMRKATRQPVRPPDAEPLDASFQMDNRGKRGIAVALNRPEGTDLVRRMAAGVDVFLCNLMTDRQAKFGLDADTLIAANPRLVHATLTGYGLGGPDARRPGYDLTAFFGRGAVLHAMAEPDNPAPPRVRPAQGDHTAALALLASILAALRLVETTGKGQRVDVSLFATAAWTMSTDLAATLVDGQNPPQGGRRARPHALHGGFRCADGRWLIMFMPEPHWWPRFAEAVQRPEWAEDPRFASHQSRGLHMADLTVAMDEVFATRPLAEWGQIFDEQGFIWAPGSTVAELAADVQAEADGLYPTIDHPGAGTFRTVAGPIRVHGADIAPRGPAPEIGQHTTAVLTELGLSGEEVAALAEAGIVGVPDSARRPSG